jgi:predicted PurR-regulated permease PerM
VLSDTRRNSAEAVTWPVRVAASWSWRLLIVAAAVYVLVRVSASVGLVIFAVIIALFLTAVLHPLEQQFRRLIPGPRSLPPLLALLTGVAVLGATGYLVAWQISSHTTVLADDISKVITQAEHWLQTGPLHLKSADLSKIATNLTQTIKTHQGQLVSGAISTVRTVSEALAGLLLVLLVTFYLLRDGQPIWAWVVRLFPRAAHTRLDQAGRAGWRTFGGYMRGQLLIALFHGVSITIVLLVLRVPLAARAGCADLPRLVHPAGRSHHYRGARRSGHPAGTRLAHRPYRRGRDHRAGPGRSPSAAAIHHEPQRAPTSPGPWSSRSSPAPPSAASPVP